MCGPSSALSLLVEGVSDFSQASKQPQVTPTQKMKTTLEITQMPISRYMLYSKGNEQYTTTYNNMSESYRHNVV